MQVTLAIHRYIFLYIIIDNQKNNKKLRIFQALKILSMSYPQ